MPEHFLSIARSPAVLGEASVRHDVPAFYRAPEEVGATKISSGSVEVARLSISASCYDIAFTSVATGHEITQMDFAFYTSKHIAARGEKSPLSPWR
jgi:hypothetical protein